MSDGPFSAIVSDIDGTLLTRVNDRISPRLKAAVAEVTARGIPFSLSTGRMRRSAWIVHQEIGANATMMCYQGAMAVDAETNTLLRHERLDESTAAEAIRFFKGRRLDIRVYVDDDVFVSHQNEEDFDYAQRNHATLVKVDDLFPLAKREPTVVLGISPPTEMGEHVADVAKLLGSAAEVTHSLPHFCEVGSPNAGKVRALHWLAERYELEPSDYITFGDGLGDLEMIRWSGRGYAVGDAHPMVIDAADGHLAGPAGEGVAEELEGLSGGGGLARSRRS
ncbi:MAG: HAD family hydrolase [Chloroflexi bacterium]|nr:HAD family hydrolase [Chloroflexota bacterium]